MNNENIKMNEMLLEDTACFKEIEYTIYFNGDPIEGTSSISDGVPTFTPTTSL